MARLSQTHLKKILTTLRRVKVRRVGLDEMALHAEIAKVLLAAGIEHRREFRFGPGCRADFWVDPGIVIEVKKRRPVRAQLEAQLTRYAKTPGVTCLILILERSITLDPTWEGIPLHVISMNAAWGVAV